jgi:hypothetical protein
MTQMAQLEPDKVRWLAHKDWMLAASDEPRCQNVASYCGRRNVPATMSGIRGNYFPVSPA